MRLFRRESKPLPPLPPPMNEEDAEKQRETDQREVEATRRIQALSELAAIIKEKRADAPR